jgi:pyruvate,water dikinase
VPAQNHKPTAPNQPIPTPAEFPPAWANAADARLYWQRDRSHFERQFGMLADELTIAIMLGFNAAAEQYGINLRGRIERFNTYLYLSFNPARWPPRPLVGALSALSRITPGLAHRTVTLVASAQARQYIPRIEAVVARLDEYWANDLLPEVRQRIAEWECFDLRGASFAQLAAHFERSIAWARRFGEIHFLVVLPELYALSQFDELYRALFPAAGALRAMRLLQGFENKSLEQDRALWQLSRRALAAPPVRQAFEALAARDVIGALAQSAEGQAFLQDLRAYLNRYGQRSNQYNAISRPSWIEDPTPVIKNLKDYVGQPDRDPAAERLALLAEREQVIADARRALDGRSARTRDRFEFLLKGAQAATTIHEDHNFWIDQRMPYQLRRIALELGRRLTEADVIPEAGDVFNLTCAEALAAVRQKASLQTVVRERRAVLERFANVTPPLTLGTTPPFAPPDEPVVRALFKELGTTPVHSATTDEVRGHAGSPGKMRGTARVIRSMAEAGKLRQGDVLVTEATMPAWTPLFATAGAVVTDAGGILSHGAIVAREYQIPAVVGTVFATTTFRDGQMLEVDGDAGIVRVIQEKN